MDDWFNRIGLTLQLAALFLVTPDLIGPDRLTQLVNYMRETKHLQNIATGAFLAYLIAAVVFFEQWYTLPMPLWVPIVCASVLAGGIFGARAIIRFWRRLGDRESRSYLGLGVLLFVIGYLCLMTGTFHFGS